MTTSFIGSIAAGQKSIGGRDTFRVGSVEEDIFVINDVVLNISPEEIIVKKRAFNNEWFTLRTEGAQRSKSGHSIAEVQLNIIFKSTDFATKLLPLVAGLRSTPFASVYNAYLESQFEVAGLDIVLALSSASFSTCGHENMPDCIRAQLNFLWFNYLPFTPCWAYKTGANHDTPGFAWNSDAWKKFYQPFLGTAPNWPKSTTTKFQWFEYKLSPTEGESVYTASNGLIDAFLSNPEKYTQLALKNSKSGGAYSSNLLLVLLKEGIASGDINSDVDSITDATFEKVADSVLGPTVKNAVERGHQYGTADAIAAMKHSRENLVAGKQQLQKSLSELQTIRAEGYTEFRNLKSIVATENSTSLGQLDLLSRERELSTHPDLLVESISVTISNILATIPMVGYQYPTCQHIGSVDMYVTMNFNSKTGETEKIHQMYDSVEKVSLNFRQIPAKYRNLLVIDEFLSIFQISELMIEGLQTSTIPTQPGRHSSTFTTVVPAITASTVLSEPEQLAQEYLQTTGDLNRAIWNVLNNYLSNRQKTTDSFGQWLIQKSGVSSSTSDTALSDLLDEAVKNYNDWVVNMKSGMKKHMATLAGSLNSADASSSIISLLQRESIDALTIVLSDAATADFIPGSDRMLNSLKRYKEVELDTTVGITGSTTVTHSSIGSTRLTDLTSTDLGIETYLAAQLQLIRKISSQYMMLPQFVNLYNRYKQLGIAAGLPAYPDFSKQLLSVSSLTGTEVIDLDPDVYLWYPIYNLNTLVDPTVISHAVSLVSQFHTKGRSEISSFYEKTYRDKLKSSRVGAPYAEAATKLADPLYPETLQYKGATHQETLNKTLLIDPGQKTHINLPEKNHTMRSVNFIQHSTNPSDWLGNGKYGSGGSPPPNTNTGRPVTSSPSSSSPSKGKRLKKDGERLRGSSGLPAVVLPAFLSEVTNPFSKKKTKVDVVLAFWPNMHGAKRPYSNAPDTVVIHSVGSGGNISKYFQSPREPGLDINEKGLTKGGQGRPAGLTPWEAVAQFGVSYKGNTAYRIASAHFVVERDGKITQCVPMGLQAWQATIVNARSFGIELAGPQSSGFPTAEMDGLIALLYTLKQNVPSLSEVIGHQDLVTYKGDPGKRFDWNRISGLGYKSIHFGDKLSTDNLKSKTTKKPTTTTAPISTPAKRIGQSVGPAQITPESESSVSPFQRAIDIYSQSALRGQGQTLMRAYPTFKLYFIEDDKGERKRLAYDDFFSYNSVQSIRVVRSRKIPADLCEIYITNISGILSNRKFKNEFSETTGQYTGGAARDSSGNIVKERVETAGTNKENPIASLLLQEGREINLRLGFSNDPEKLTTVFNGMITGIEFSENEDLVHIIAQSFAVELVSDIKGYEKPKTYSVTYLFGWDVWGLNDGATTGKILEEMLSQPEVLHFGLWKARNGGQNDNRILLTDKWQLHPQPQEDNLFPPPSDAMLSDSALVKRLRFVIQKDIIWDIIQEMTLRHPNYIAAAVPYRDENSERMTLFFGLPEQLYFARAPSIDEQIIQRQLKAVEKEQNKILVADLERDRLKREIVSMWDKSTVDELSQQKAALGLLQRSIFESRLNQAIESGWIAPFRSYHLLTSANHIISNNIQANSRDVANTVAVQWNKHLMDFDMKKNNIVAAGDEDITTVKLDSALPTEEIRTQVATFINVNNKELARRYGLSLLHQNVKDIYRGEIIIIGNPDVKPFDCCYIYDEYTDMVGPIEVEQVTHVFDQSHGFRTEIIPDMVCHINHFSTLTSNEAMGYIFEGLLKKSSEPYAYLGTQTRVAETVFAPFANIVGRAFNAWGGFVSEKVISFTQDAHPIIMTPLMVHGRAFTGGVSTRKLPISMWNTVFSDWKSEYDKGYSRWKEDVSDDMLELAKKYTLQYSGRGY